MLALLALSTFLTLAQPSSLPGLRLQDLQTGEEGILIPGGSFTASNGVTVRAPMGVLTAPVHVYARTLEPSSVTLPLPDGWARLSSFYSVGAIEETGSKNRESFQVELPVPHGETSRGLSVGLLVPPEYGRFPQAGEEVEPFWDSTSAARMSGLDRLGSRTSILPAQGFVYVVIRGRNITIPPGTIRKLEFNRDPKLTM